MTVDPGDVFTIECDIDKQCGVPTGQRTALSVMYDGSHLRYCISTGDHDVGREIYLTPENARNVAELVMRMTGDSQQIDTTTAAAAAAGCASILAAVALILAIIALVL